MAPDVCERSLLPGVLAVGFLLAMSPAAAADPWVPVDCSERQEEVAAVRRLHGISVTSWRDHNRAVREARPGDPLYVPRPFPRSEQQVIEDFRHGYFGRLFDDPRHVPEEERPVFEALRAGELESRVSRVENWRNSRCSSDRAIPFHHLVVLTDSRGRERSRAVVHATGVMGRYARLSRPGPLPAPEDLEGFLAAELGVHLAPRDVQLVAVDGMPLPCDAVFPCIAFRAGPEVFLLAPGPLLYRISPDAARASVLERWERQRSEVLMQPDAEEPWVSVGFGWVRARRVAGAWPDR